MASNKAPLKSQVEWKETTGQMPIGEAYDAAKKAAESETCMTDFFSHEAKKVSKEEFLAGIESQGVKTLLDVVNACGKKKRDGGQDDPNDGWPIVQVTHFPYLSQPINDALSAIDEYACNLIGIESLGMNPANL